MILGLWLSDDRASIPVNERCSGNFEKAGVNRLEVAIDDLENCAEGCASLYVHTE